MRFAGIVLLTCAVLLLLSGCGYTPPRQTSTTTTPGQTPVTITATGAASSVRLGDPAVQFTATISNASTTSFTWAVNGTAGGSATLGTIDATGKYTPPAVGATTLQTGASVSITASAAGVTSNAVTLSLNNPVPTVTAVNIAGGGSTITVGTQASITVVGTNFVQGAQITVAGTAVTTQFVDAQHLTASISASSVGNLTIGVKNPDPGSASSASTVTVAAVSAGPLITGVVAKGLLQKGAIEVWAVDPNTGADVGTAPLGAATTANDGTFSVQLGSTPAAGTPLRVKAKNGQYVDESNINNTIASTIELDSLIDDGSKSVSGLAVTPVTDMINAATVAGVSSGTDEVATAAFNGAASAVNVAAAKSNATTLIKGHWGLTSNPSTTAPKYDANSITSDPDGFKVGLLNGAMLTCARKAVASNPSLDLGNFVKALSQDISDGLFDGMYIKAGVKTQVIIPNTSPAVPLSSSAGTTDFLLCLNQYVSAPNTSISSIPNVSTAVAPLVNAISGAVTVSPATPKAAGLSAGTSSAMGTLTINGKQWLFVAARNTGIVAVDISDPNATSPTIKAWTTLATTLFGTSAQVGGVIPVVGLANHAQLFVFAFNTKHVALVNAEVLVSGTPTTDDAKAINTNPISSDPNGGDFQGDLAIQNGATSFSGGSAFIAGGLADNGVTDSTKKGIWLATSDGYAFFDLSLKALGKIYPVLSGQELPENVGGDVTHGIIYGGNYSGVQLVDLKGGQSYALDNTFYTTNFSFGEIDHDAVDSGYQVGVSTLEHDSHVQFVALATIVKTTATTGNTFVPATTNGFASVNVGTSVSLSACAVDSTTHLVLLTEEYGSEDVVVGQLDNPAAPKGSSYAGLVDWATYNTFNSTLNGTMTGGLIDPHGVGVVYNSVVGKPYGYMLNGTYTYLLQIDMQGQLNAARAGTTGDAAHTVKDDPATTSPAIWRTLRLK